MNESEISHLLLALVLLLGSAHLFGYLFQTLALPRVIGEIAGGLVLGPTLLGHLAPALYGWIFHAFAAQTNLLAFVYWLGLVLLMFVSGFEIKRSFNRHDRKIIVAVVIGGTLVPLLAGWVLPAFYNVSTLIGSSQSMLALQIVISIAVAVTSIPVISKIFIDLGIIGTRFATIVIAAATIEDLFLWGALTVATGLVNSQSVSTGDITKTVALSAAFLTFGLFILPGAYKTLTRLCLNSVFDANPLAYALLTALALTVLAGALGVNIIFGALIAGLAVGDQPDEHFGAAKNTIKHFALAFFIPIYFALVGLRLDLIHDFDPLFFAGFLLFAVTFKLLGTLLSAKLTNLNWLSSLNLAMAMNARGGPGIVLATVAFDSGIINEIFFATLIVFAIATSLFAGYWFKALLSRNMTLLSAAPDR